VADGAALGELVRVKLTTVTGTHRFQRYPGPHFVDNTPPKAGADQVVIRLDDSRRFQTMLGFGAALTESSAHLIWGLPSEARDALLQRLFGPPSVGGAALSFLRLPIGVSDFSISYDWSRLTYDDVPGDYVLRHFSTSRDDAFFLPLLRQIAAINPDLRIVSTPWTAPLWMKTVAQIGAGSLRESPQVFDAYARYLVRYLEEYDAKGVRVHYLTLQNEPGHINCGPMPCMAMSPHQQLFLARRVGRLLRASHRPNVSATKILAYDHNWGPDLLHHSGPPPPHPPKHYPPEKRPPQRHPSDMHPQPHPPQKHHLKDPPQRHDDRWWFWAVLIYPALVMAALGSCLVWRLGGFWECWVFQRSAWRWSSSGRPGVAVPESSPKGQLNISPSASPLVCIPRATPMRTSQRDLRRNLTFEQFDQMEVGERLGEEDGRPAGSQEEQKKLECLQPMGVTSSVGCCGGFCVVACWAALFTVGALYAVGGWPSSSSPSNIVNVTNTRAGNLSRVSRVRTDSQIRNVSHKRNAHHEMNASHERNASRSREHVRRVIPERLKQDLTKIFTGPDWPSVVLDSEFGSEFAGVAWHCYSGGPATMGRFAANYPSVEQHMTECSGGTWSGPFGGSLKWNQRVILMGNARNWGQSTIQWNLALDENHGPHCQGGACCTGCRGVVTIPSYANSLQQVNFNVEFFGLAHHSAYLRPGAQRISTMVINGMFAANAVGYRNLDGSHVLVVLNGRLYGRTIRLRVVIGDVSFRFLMPPGVATFTWGP